MPEDNVMKETHMKERINLIPSVMPELENGQSGVTRSRLAFPVCIQHIPDNEMKQSFDKVGFYPIAIYRSEACCSKSPTEISPGNENTTQLI